MVNIHSGYMQLRDEREMGKYIHLKRAKQTNENLNRLLFLCINLITGGSKQKHNSEGTS